MSKCIINEETLKQIRSKTTQILRSYKKNKESISTLKQNMKNLLDEISKEKYSLIDTPQIIENIYNTVQRYGVVEQSSNFFSIENLTNLLTGANQGIQRINVLETSTDKIADVEQVRIRSQVNREFLNNAYGLAKEVRTYVENKTNQNIFDCCFINRGSVDQNIGIVKNNSDLNRNIRQYQQSLLQDIADYFNYIISIYPELQVSENTKQLLQNPRLYDENNKNTEILENEEIQSLIKAYISPTMFSTITEKTDALRQLYNTAQDSSKSLSERQRAQLKLNAYNANVILSHFDTYLSIVLGNAIEIDDFNVKTGQNKYQIAGTTAKLATTWRVSENINVESEADAVTKLAINTTPLFTWQNDTPLDGRYLFFSDFEHTIAKIKDLSYREDVQNILFNDTFINDNEDLWNSLSNNTKQFLKGKTLSQAINYIRKNPRQYLSAVFEILTNKEFYNLYKNILYNKNIFTEDELNKLYSLAKGIFNPGESIINVNGVSKKSASLYSLCEGSNIDIDYYSFITQTVDSIFSVSYIQYYKDEDGITQVRTLIDQSVNNIRRGIEQIINANNSIKLIKDFEAYKDTISLRQNEGDQFEYIKFKLPNQNIEVKVFSASGTVTFTNLDTGKKITNFDLLWNENSIKEYIDSILKIGISTDINLQNALRRQATSYDEMCKNLLSFAARVQLNQYVSYEFIKDLSNSEKEAQLKQIYGKNAPKYNYQLGELGLIHGTDIPFFKKIALAKANIIGVTTSAQVKDGEGNNQSLQTLSRLIGSLQSQFDLQEKQPWSATSEAILLTIPGLYEGISTAKEFHDQFGNNKASTEMGVSEMSYASVIQDFFGGLLLREDDSFVGNGHVLFLPSVNSDKGTIGRIKINLNKTIDLLKYNSIVDEQLLKDSDFIAFVKDNKIQNVYSKETRNKFRQYLNNTNKANKYITKPIKTFNSQQLEYIIAQEFGTIYTKMYKNIVSDWAKLDEFIANFDIPSLANDYLYGFSNFNNWWNTQGSHIEIITNKYGKSKEIRVGNTYRESSPADFIKKITLEYNKTHRLNPLEIIDQVHYRNNKGQLSINDAFISQIARFKPTFLKNIGPNFNIDAYPTSTQFWTIKKAEVLKSLLKSKFKVNTTGKKSLELTEIRRQYPQWINSSGDMILAKLNGKNITSNKDLIALQEKIGAKSINDLIDQFRDRIILNPILEQYNYLHYLFTQEFMCSTVGSFIAHPEKSKDWTAEEIEQNGRTETSQERVLRKEAAHFQAQHKRNVSYTAAMHAFQLNLLNGIPEEYNIAVIEDIKDEQSTIIGLNNEIKPFDGATFVNPFVVILENNSLGGARAGISKKQFVHFKNERTGTGGIIKTAGFGLTNDWIRNSPFLERMMRKMTNHVWLNKNGSVANIDITHDYKGNKIKYKNVYFTKNGQIYQMGKIKVVTLVNPITNETTYRYIPEIYELAQDSNKQADGTVNRQLSNEEVIDLFSDTLNYNNGGFEINTNYQLWNFFGGKNSMDFKNEDRFLSLSNTSVENVVQTMNNTGTVIGNPEEIETQDQLWQPLKHVDVHYVPTAGAVKQGAANINSADKYSNDEDYDIQKIKMYQSGIQLDKEHHADDSELSLMTQVISACAAKGYTLEAAIGLYDALRKSTEAGIKEHLNAVKEAFTTNNNTNLQEVLMKSIINALSTSNSNRSNFAEIIASDLIRQAREGKAIKFSEVYLPLSDNTVYAKILSIVSSYLTNSGIKQKIPGILSVLTPSHNIFKLYAGRKYESFTNPEQELAELQSEEAPVFDSTYQWTQGQGDFAGLQLVYVNPGELISQIDGQPVAMRNPHDGRVLIDLELMKVKFDQKAWRNTRNSKPLDYDFKTFDEWMRFALLHEAMYNVYLIKEGESRFDYETRVNEQALKRIQNNISNLELGREYFITRDVMTEVEDADGNFIQVPVPQTQSELIRTTSEYRKLKQDILDGKVTRVVENVTVGRDLAAFNVRFNTTDGRRFQLWDLDSASALFEINEIKDSNMDAMAKDEAILAAAERVLGRTLYLQDLPNIELWIRRLLQRDLMNLSSSTPALNKQYKQLLNSNNRTQEWFNRYAQWVNIYLGTGLGSELELGSNSILIPKNDLVYIGPGETTQEVAARIGGIDTLRHPDANGMHFGNPFSHSNYRGVQKVFPTVKEAVIAYEQWLRGEAYQDIEPERRQWILEQINSGALDNKPLVYYRMTVPDTSYGTQLGGMLYTYDKSPNHAHILQKLIIEHNPFLARPSISSRTTVNANNFAQIEPIVRQLLANTTKVKIGGQLVDVDKSSVVTQPYEHIMPKTFATNFGLKEFDDLNTISNDQDFFIKQYLRNQKTNVEENQYTVELKVSSGEHYYLLDKRQLINTDLIKVNNIFTAVIDGKTYRVDSKGNTMYELTEDTQIYKDVLGHEVIVTDNLDFYVENLHFDSIKLSSRLRTRPSIVESLMKQFKESKKRQVKSFYRYVISHGNRAESILQLNEEYHSLSLDNYKDYIKEDPVTGKRTATNSIIRECWAKHTSFLKALDIVAARIPAQHMQSFMPMKIVAFDNPDINTAHVSTMQILLQGSDF